MADPSFDQIGASTLASLRADIVWDNFFIDSASQRVMRAAGAVEPFLGGTIMQEPFQFDRVNGGAIAPGSDLNVAQKTILAATMFYPKEYVEQVPINLWQTQVINAGPAGKVKLYDLYMRNAVQSANTDLGIDFYRHGQASGGTVSDNRQIFLNGASEACNDGINPSWDGNVFTNYGGQVRNGAVGNVLNSVPLWAGTQSGGTGQATYKLLLEGYLNAVQAPDTGLTNKAFFAYMLEREETKQRFASESTINPSIGLSGFKIMDAWVHVDKLCPSTKYGTILPSGLSQTTSIQPKAFTTPTYSAGQNAISNFPSNTTVTPGEIFWWFRLKDWKIRPSEDPEYNHNFTPPIRSTTNADLVVMFYKLALNMYTPVPRDNVQILGCGF